MEKNYQTFVLSAVSVNNLYAGNPKKGSRKLHVRMLTFLSAVFFFLVFIQQANAYNCGWGGGQDGSVNFTGWTSGSQSAGCYAGNYIAIYGTVSGQTYRISTCGASWDTELQAFNSSGSSLGYNDDSGPACSGLPSSMDFTATGGTNYIRLTKYNCASGSSWYSGISVQLTYNPCAAASTPGSISAWSTGTTTASASWSASGGTATITYYWYCSNGASGSTTGTSASVGGLAANSQYRFQVYANNCGGSSGTVYSSYFYTYPNDPSGVSFGTNPVCNGGSTTLTASGVQGTVYWYTGGCGSTYIGYGNGLTVYPTVSTTYYARNNNGNWSSGCASATVTVNNPATMPATAVCSSTTQNTAALSWGASSGTPTITHYWVVGTSASVVYGTVGVSGVVAQGTTNVSTTTATATGLTASTSYYLRVYANSTASPCGASGYRTSTMFTTVPLAPVAGAATLVRANSFTANWAASTGATGYYLDVSTSATFASYLTGYQNRNVGNVLLLSLTGLNREITYYYRVRAYNAGGFSVNSSTISLLTLPLNNFLIQNTSNASIGEQLAGQAFNIKITARDEFNTTVTDFTSTVAITTNSVLTSGATTTAFVAGVKSSHSVTLTQAGESNKSLTATSGSVATTSTLFTVTPAAINSYTLSVIGTITAGTPFSVLATVYDQYNNLKINYDGANSVNWTTTATSSLNNTARIIPANGNQSFSRGVATISGFTLFNSHETPTITITDGITNSPGTTAAITVHHAILDNFLVVAGTSQTAGTSFSTTVTARDIYWNTAITYVGNIRFKSSDDALVEYPAGLQPYALSDNGVRTFTSGVTINTVGSYWLRAADAIYAFKSGEQKNIVVGPGAFAPAAVKSVVTVDDLNKIAGQEVKVTLTPKDVYGNLLYSCQNISVLLDGAVKAGTHQETHGTVSGADGVYTFYVPVTSTTDNNIISAKIGLVDFVQTYDITVTPAPPTAANTLITSTGGITTDETKVITVQLYDKYNNLRTTDDGDLLLTTTLGLFGGYSGAKTVSAVYGAAGSGSYTATLYASTDGLQGTGTATITGHLDPNETAGPGDYVAGVSPYAHVAAPWPAHFNITDGTTVVISEGLPNLSTSVISSAEPATMTTDENRVITVQLKDHLGNLIRSDRGTVTFTTSLGGFDHTNGHSPVTTTYNGTTTGSYSATLYASYSGSNNGVGTATITGVIAATGVNGSFEDNTTTVEITEGLPRVATNEITAASYAITADQNTLVTVQLKDALGNLITHNRGVVALSVTPIGVIDNGIDAAGASAIAANYTTAGKYTATFKLNAFGVGNATITGKLDGSADYTDNAIILVSHGAATKLVVFTQPATTTYIAGVSFSPQPVIHIKDQWNNITTSDGATVVTAARGSTGTSTLHGTLTATASAGVVTFSNLSYQLAESINIAFTSGSLTLVTSSTFTVVHNVPTYLAITGSPTQTAGVAQTITVKAYDTYSNLADRFAGTKSFTFSGANDSPEPPYHPTVQGTGAAIPFGSATNLSFASGSATASMILYKEETVDIASNHTDAAYTDIITGASALNINAASGNRLHVVVAQAAPAYFAVTGSSTQVAGVAQTITIRAYDNFNNPATNYQGTKSITFGGPGVSPAPSTSPTINGHVIGTATDLVFNSSGVATASMVLYKVENILVASSDGSISTRTSPGEYRLSVNVTHAPASYYSVTPTSNSQTAGTSQNITVAAFDAFNNPATTYAGDVALTFTGANPSPAPSTNPTVTNKTSVATAFSASTTVTFAGGTSTRSMALYLVETAHIVATSGSGLTEITTPEIDGYDYRAAVTVNHAANTYFAVTGSTSDQTAGTSRDITIKMYDPYNNLATGYTNAHTITFSGAAASPNTPNAAFNPTVNGTAFGTGTALSFSAGIAASIPMVLYNVESAHIVATDGSLTTPSSRNAIDYRLNIGVIHATEDFMTISGTGTQTAGTPQTITVRAYDHYSNLATRYDGAKSLTFSGASASPEYLPTPSVSPVIGATVFGSATSLTFAAGVVTASMNLYKVETAHITATNGTITAGSHMLDVTVSHATPNYLAITGTATQTAGTSQTITVTAYDTYNNVATGYTGSKSLTFSGANDAATSPVTHPTFGGTSFGLASSLSFSSGVATGTLTLYKTETAYIYATDGSINANSSEPKDHRLPVLVGPTLLKDFLVYGVGSTVSTHTEHYYGEWQSVTVEPRDTYNNRKTNYNKGITFTLTDPGAVKPADYFFTSGVGGEYDNGVHTFTNAVQFSKPSDPYSPDALGWWVTAVSILEPGKYGYQSDIWVVDRPITITANNATKDYYGDVYTLGSTAFAVTSSLSPVMPYQTGSVTVREQVTSVGLTSTGTPATALAGDHPIVTATATGINGFNPDYYNITYATAGTLTVHKRPITISVTPALTQTKVYGDNNPAAYTYAITSTSPFNALVNGDVFSGLLARTAGENVGTYGIDQGSLTIYNNGTSTNKYANYEVTFVGGTFNITPKPITVTANTSQTKIYGNLDPTPFTYTANPAIGSALPNTITVALTGALTRVAGEDVGSYSITQGGVTDANNTNYTITYVANNFAITTKAITVTANTGQTKIYGNNDPLPYTYTASPAIGFRLPVGIDVALSGLLTRTAAQENVGAYAITQGTLTNGNNTNYSITYVPNDFTITTRDITVTANTLQTKVYGVSDPTPFTYTANPVIGFEMPNGILVALSGALTRDAGQNVGLYAITQGTVTNANNTNYNITAYTPNNFSITRKAIAIDVTAAQTKVYGDLDPAFAFTSNPAIADLPYPTKAWTGALVRVNTSENVASNYAITQGTLELSDANSATSLATNYTVTFTGADFSITRKAIAVTPVALQDKTYGNTDPVFTYTTVPAIDAVLTNGIHVALSGSLTRAEGENVGTYAITQGTVTSTTNTNYTVSFTDNVLFTINRRNILVTATAGQSKTYGDVNPTYLYTTSPDAINYTLPNGNTVTLSGALSRAAGENVGAWAITQGTIDNSTNPNYNVSFTANDFTINRKPITVTANTGQTKVYGYDDPVFTYTTVPAEESLLANGIVVDLSGLLTRDAGNNVGLYAIRQGTVTNATNGNYDIPAGSFTTHDFSITERPITLRANNRTKVYSYPITLGNTQFSISSGSMAYSEEINTVVMTSAGEPDMVDVGVYPIATASAVGSVGYLVTNYNITYSNAGTLTVTTRPLTLLNFAAANKVYDGYTTVIGTGFDDDRVAGDLLAFTYNANFADQHAANGKAVNYTAVTIVGGADQFNYHLLNGATYNTATTANITAKPLTLTANNLSKTQGTTYTFLGTEFGATAMVTGESVASVTLASEGAASGASTGTYPITIGSAVAGAATTLSDYSITYTNGVMTVGASGRANLSGYVMYDPYEGADLPISGSTVTIRDGAGTILYTATTNSAGLYQFTDVPVSIARLGVSVGARAWSGVNATDALAIQLRGVSTPPAYWTPSTFLDYVGNVGNEGGNTPIESQDVLQVKGRVLHPTNPAYYFTPAYDWAFFSGSTVFTQIDASSAYSASMAADGGGVIPTVWVRPFGDIYGDYAPTSGKSVIPIQTDEVVNVTAGEMFELPVRVMNAIDFSALTLELKYDASKLKIEGLTSDIPGLKYVVESDIIRAVWSRIEPLHYTQGQSLVNLQLRTLVPVYKTDQVLLMDTKTQFGDNLATVIPDVSLAVASIATGSTGIGQTTPDNFTFEAYPNPFIERVNLSYTLPEAADIQITLVEELGKTVKVLVADTYQAGAYTFDYLSGGLPTGTYYLKVNVKAKNNSFIKVYKLVHLK